MSSSFYWLVVVILVVWRITHLLQAEDGPWNLITRLRRLLGNSRVGELLYCFYCLSLWVAAPLAYLLGTSWLQRLLLWPALSGAAILLERMSEKPTPTANHEQCGESSDVVLRQEQNPE
jgi:hypothetical protein